MFSLENSASCNSAADLWWQNRTNTGLVFPEEQSSTCQNQNINQLSDMVSYSRLVEDSDRYTTDLSGVWSLELGNVLSSIDLNFWWQLILSQLWYVFGQMRFLFFFVWPSDTMFSSLKEVPRYVAEVRHRPHHKIFPAFVLIAIIENGVRLLQGKRAVRVNETIGSLSQGVFQECLRIKIRSIEVLMYCLVWENLRIYTMPWDSLWTWWTCFLCVDLGFYMAHRLAHEVNFIWAVHQAHHSSQEFAIVSALRQAVLQPFTAWFTYTPFALFIPPQVFLVHLQLSELYMVWIHTEVVDTIGPLELILNTPSHHRVHHSRNPEYIDKNYGGVLIIWDRLLGTFQVEDKQNPPVYGLVHPVNSFNPIYIQFHPWPVILRRIREAKGIKDKLGILFMGPGWRPGLPRLGYPSELPKITHPLSTYDPPLNLWTRGYIVIHFALLILFYHELTLYQKIFNPITVNLAIINLLVTITTLGLMLDNKRRYNNSYELLRCLLYFFARQYIGIIINHGLTRSEIPARVRLLIMVAIDGWFVASVFLNLICLSKQIVWGKLTPTKLNRNSLGVIKG